MAGRVFVVRELNCYEREPLPMSWLRRLLGRDVTRRVERCSLWLVGEPYDREQDDYTERGIRLAGPADPVAIEGLRVRLVQTLREAGLTVVEEAACDD